MGRSSMHSALWKRCLLLLALLAATVVVPPPLGAAQQTANRNETVIPFEMINRHVFLKIRINNSAPLSFIFDTGDRYAVVDLDRAKALGLNLQGEIHVGGAGAEVRKGATVTNASFTLPGLEGFSQPVNLAFPLGQLAPRIGHDVDGI